MIPEDLKKDLEKVAKELQEYEIQQYEKAK